MHAVWQHGSPDLVGDDDAAQEHKAPPPPSPLPPPEVTVDLELQAFSMDLMGLDVANSGNFRELRSWQDVRRQFEKRQLPPIIDTNKSGSVSVWMRESKRQTTIPRELKAADALRRKRLAEVVKPIPDHCIGTRRTIGRMGLLPNTTDTAPATGATSPTLTVTPSGSGALSPLSSPPVAHGHHHGGAAIPATASTDTASGVGIGIARTIPASCSVATPLCLEGDGSVQAHRRRLVVTPTTFHTLAHMGKPETYRDGAIWVATILDSNYRHRNHLWDEAMQRNSKQFRLKERTSQLVAKLQATRAANLSCFLVASQRPNTQEHHKMDDRRVLLLFDGFVACCHMHTTAAAAAAAGCSPTPAGNDGVGTMEWTDVLATVYVALGHWMDAGGLGDAPLPEFNDFVAAAVCGVTSTAEQHGCEGTQGSASTSTGDGDPRWLRWLRHAFATHVTPHMSGEPVLQQLDYREACKSAGYAPSSLLFRGHELDGLTFQDWLCKQFPNAARFAPATLSKLRAAGAIPFPQWVDAMFQRFGAAMESPRAGSSGARPGTQNSNAVSSDTGVSPPASRGKAAAAWGAVSHAITATAHSMNMNRTHGQQGSVSASEPRASRLSLSNRGAANVLPLSPSVVAAASVRTTTAAQCRKVLLMENLAAMIREGNSGTQASQAPQAAQAAAHRILQQFGVPIGQWASPSRDSKRLSLDASIPVSHASVLLQESAHLAEHTLGLMWTQFCHAVDEDPALHALGRW